MTWHLFQKIKKIFSNRNHLVAVFVYLPLTWLEKRKSTRMSKLYKLAGECLRTDRFLTGNYAPIHTTLSCSPCNIIGQIPEEFVGGQYVRNGSNPLRNDSKRDFHWFDGDGMLTGVYFERVLNEPGVQALFSNQYIVTDIYRAARKHRWTYPLVPSVATLVNPVSSSYRILYEVIRSMVLILASIWHLISRPIKRVSAANTNILYHDGRMIATMEIGPPMRVYLPSLKTVGWFTGIRAEGEYIDADTSKPYFGGQGIEGFYKEMTTAHVCSAHLAFISACPNIIAPSRLQYGGTAPLPFYIFTTIRPLFNCSSGWISYHAPQAKSASAWIRVWENDA